MEEGEKKRGYSEENSYLSKCDIHRKNNYDAHIQHKNDIYMKDKRDANKRQV